MTAALQGLYCADAVFLTLGDHKASWPGPTGANPNSSQGTAASAVSVKKTGTQRLLGVFGVGQDSKACRENVVCAGHAGSFGVLLGLQGMPGTWCAVPAGTAPDGGEEVAQERKPAGDSPTEVRRAWCHGLEGARKGARRAATGPAARPASSPPRGRKPALPPQERQLRRLWSFTEHLTGPFTTIGRWFV